MFILFYIKILNIKLSYILINYIFNMIIFLVLAFYNFLTTYESDQFYLVDDFYVKNREISVKEWNIIASEHYKSSLDFCLHHINSCHDYEIVKGVNFYDSIIFLNLISRKEKLPECYIIKNKEVVLRKNCKGYRMPTKDEWLKIYSKQLNIFGLHNDICEWTWDPNKKLKFKSKKFYKLDVENEPFLSENAKLRGCVNSDTEEITYIGHYVRIKTGLRPVRSK